MEHNLHTVQRLRNLRARMVVTGEFMVNADPARLQQHVLHSMRDELRPHAALMAVKINLADLKLDRRYDSSHWQYEYTARWEPDVTEGRCVGGTCDGQYTHIPAGIPLDRVRIPVDAHGDYWAPQYRNVLTSISRNVYVIGGWDDHYRQWLLKPEGPF